MLETDVAIIGCGLAGSTAAAMLGRAGIATMVVDPHTEYPPDFRCEKLDGSQIAALEKTGLAGPILAKGTMNSRILVVRGGRVVDNKPRRQCNILYNTMVNAMRGEIPQGVERVTGKVTDVINSTERQTLTLSSGETVSARLVIFASGLNVALRESLGIDRKMISAGHSVSIGFDIAPKDGGVFDFEALTYFSEQAADRLAYLSLFPIGPVKRANLFVYRDMTDPWLVAFRKAPQSALETLLPRLTHVIGDFKVTDTPRIRSVDLVTAGGHIQPGVVLVGDAFGTSCPAAGTGCNKVFTDVERLCHAYVPAWLATPGMGADKIAAFYADPEKRAADTQSRAKAFRLKALSTEKGLAWSARRHGRYFWHLAMGTLRRVREGAGAHLLGHVVAGGGGAGKAHG